MNKFSMNTKQLGLGFILSAIIFSGVLMLASCAPAADTNAIAKELTRLDDEWSNAAVAKNVEKVASFYAADAIAYPPNEPVAIGQAAAKKVWASYLNDSTFSISWKTEHAGASKSGELGFTAGTYENSYRGPGGKMVTEKGKYLCTWAKQPDGTWKATHDMWNSDSK
jgi:ketosteroid isomerase-like protein